MQRGDSKSKRKRVEKWIIENSKFLRLRTIDEELKFPKNTLQKFVKYKTPLSDERIEKLYSFALKSRIF